MSSVTAKIRGRFFRQLICLLFVLPALLWSTAAFSAVAEDRPFAEYEPVRWLVLSAGFDCQTRAIKQKILQNLPDGVQVLVYGKTENDLQKFMSAVPAGVTAGVLKMLTPIVGEPLWPRDSMPMPVIRNGQYEFVDAPYDLDFEPDRRINKLFGLPVRRHQHAFEHGNLVATRAGDCYVVEDNFAWQMPDQIFYEFYSCSRLTRLPFTTGIGHVDEVLKFVSDTHALTNQVEIKKLLERRGYTVSLLPEAKLPQALASRGVMPQRSYINSLLINDTVFVPVFGLDSDETALDAYRAAGLKVIAVDSTYVSDYGGGALHCLTMTYPDFSAKP